MTDRSHNRDADSDSPPVAIADDGASGLLWLHSVFFWMSLTVIGLSFLLRAPGPQSVYLPGASFPLPELCTAKGLFGVPCPGCGLTRSFISISHGQLGRAWGFNPVSFLLYPFVFVQIPWNAMQYWFIRKRGYGLYVPFIHLLPITIAVIMLLQWLIRLPQLLS